MSREGSKRYLQYSMLFVGALLYVLRQGDTRIQCNSISREACLSSKSLGEESKIVLFLFYSEGTVLGSQGVIAVSSPYTNAY